MSKMTPIHPGEHLKEDFMEPLGLGANRLAKAIGVPANRISEIVAGRRSLSPETALRLSAYFGTTAELWMNLQARYDLRRAQAEARRKGSNLGKDLRRIAARPAYA